MERTLSIARILKCFGNIGNVPCDGEMSEHDCLLNVYTGHLSVKLGKLYGEYINSVDWK